MNQWILIKEDTGTIGLACPSLEKIKGGGWVLYTYDWIKQKPICTYFGGNLSTYKKAGWSRIGPL